MSMRAILVRKYHHAGRFFALVASALLLLTFVSGASAAITVTDIKGRQVSLPKPAHRLVIDDGRMIIALGFLTDDPVSMIAAWPHDVDRFGRELYADYQKRFPQIDALPKSTSNAQDMAVEQILAGRPDAVVLSVFSHPAEEQLKQLDDAGIPVIFVDFVTNPLKNTDISLEILGTITGREEQAQRVVELRQQHRALIAQRARDVAVSDKPSVFLEPHASTQEACCNSPGGAGIGTFIDFAGARNIGDILKGKPSGQLSPEYILASKPEVYIATGGEYMKSRGGLLVGPRFDAQMTSLSLQQLLERPGFAALPAAQDHAVHGFSQQLFNSPLDMLALELIAKWSHPKLFADLDVEETRRALNALSAVPLSGLYWTE
ncbi:ABC transporter substrate-binding protein [Rhizobium sp. Root708]|nr:ABC transporter substrate-binding protein [Rhizobium sp. Root708]